jgi:hypothetical protein
VAMKAILEFDLNDHDDCMSHARAVRADDMAICLAELHNNLWRKWKHSEIQPTGDDVLQEMYSIIDNYKFEFLD